MYLSKKQLTQIEDAILEIKEISSINKLKASGFEEASLL